MAFSPEMPMETRMPPVGPMNAVESRSAALSGNTVSWFLSRVAASSAVFCRMGALNAESISVMVCLGALSRYPNLSI